jgi:hypothetical protein
MAAAWLPPVRTRRPWSGISRGGRRASAPLSEARWQAAWADLADADAVKAYRAMWTLAADPQTVSALRQRLKPLAPADAAGIARSLVDLDSAEFQTRARATAALEKLGHLAEPALQQALEANPRLEARRRLEQLLAKLAEPGAERVRERRALEALGHIVTPEARNLLEALAAGSPVDALARDARAILERQRKRASAP